MVLVLLRGGRSWIGAQDLDPAGHNYDPLASAAQTKAGPVHEVELSPYLLSKYELTRGQWARLTGEHPNMYKPTDLGPPLLNPVEYVSWDEFAKWLPRVGLALPSEAQWEQAARAGTATVWSTGDAAETLLGSANLGGHPAAGWPGDGLSGHAAVGSLSPNGFGLHDVHGNVWEWCQDGLGEGGFYGRSPVLDPVAPAAETGVGVARAWRGGGFGNPPFAARSAHRTFRSPSFVGGHLGVRPARLIAQ